MPEKLNFYSGIALLESTGNGSLISDLQYRLAKRYRGKSTISLPPHITLIRWKSSSSRFSRLKPKIHLKAIEIKVKVENIEKSSDQSSIWYKVHYSKSLLDLRDSIRATLVEYNVPKDDITLNDKFHITLAYKDYNDNTIDKIYRYLKRIAVPSFFTLHTNIVVACQRGPDTVWLIVDPVPPSRKVVTSVS